MLRTSRSQGADSWSALLFFLIQLRSVFNFVSEMRFFASVLILRKSSSFINGFLRDNQKKIAEIHKVLILSVSCLPLIECILTITCSISS